MTQDQIKALVEIYRQDLLPEWEVEVEFFDYDDPEGDNAASVSRSEDYFTATLSLFKGWETNWGEDNSYMEVTLVHELIHILCRDVDRSVDLVKQSISPETFQVFWSFYRHAREGTVERLAQFIVRKDRIDRIKTATCVTCGGCVVVQ